MQLLVENNANRTSLRSYPHISSFGSSGAQNAVVERLLTGSRARCVDRILDCVIAVHAVRALVDHCRGVAHSRKEAGHSPDRHKIGRRFAGCAMKLLWR